MFRYIGMFFRGLYKLVFAYPKLVWYSRRKDKYPLEKRYAFVRRLVFSFVKAAKINITVLGENVINERDGILITPNHQSVIDAILLIYLSEKPVIFVNKVEVEGYPYIGRVIKIIDSISLKRENLKESAKVLIQSRDCLLANQNVAIFPEGTRTKEEDKSVLEFKGGSLRPAYSAKTDILPIMFNGTYKILSKEYKKDKNVTISFLEIEPYESFKDKNTVDLANELRDKIQAELKKEAI